MAESNRRGQQPAVPDGPAPADGVPVQVPQGSPGEPGPAPTPQPKPGLAERLRRLTGSVGCAAARFPVAFVLLAVGTVLTVIVDRSRLSSLFGSGLSSAQETASLPLEVMGHLMRDCLAAFPAAVVARLAAERCGARQGLVWQLVAAAAVGGGVQAIALRDERLGAVEMSGMTMTELWLVAAFVVPVFVGLWLLYTDDNEDALLPALVSDAAFAGFVAGVLSLGLAIVIGAFDALVLDVRFSVYETALQVCWLFVCPAVFLSQLPTPGEYPRVPRAWQVVVGYVIFPLLLMLLGVLYLYLGRIALTRTLPSGEMNWYGSFALLACLVLWAGLRTVEGPLARWFVRWGSLLLVPVTAVQLYCVSVRLAAYGLTPPRYLSLACTGVGIAGLALGALGRRPRTLCLVAAVVAVVALVSPANALDMANLDQSRVLSSALDVADGGGALPEGERERVHGAWSYLRTAGAGYLGWGGVQAQARDMDLSAFEARLGYATDALTDGSDPYDPWSDDAIGYLWADCVETGVDVSGYSTVWPIEPFIDGVQCDADGTVTVTLMVDADGTYVLDLTELAAQLHEGTLPGEAYGDPNGWRMPDGGLTLELPGGERAIVTYLGIDLEGEAITGVDLNGYLLVP